MMWQEFESIAGYEVTFEDYSKIIEPMYMALDMDKHEFVKLLDRKRFDYKAKEKAEKKAMIKAMREIAEERAQNCEHFSNYDAENKLSELADEFVDKFYHKNLGYQGDIERRNWADISRSCTYPSDLIIYRVIQGRWYEIERIELARWQKIA